MMFLLHMEMKKLLEMIFILQMMNHEVYFPQILVKIGVTWENAFFRFEMILSDNMSEDSVYQQIMVNVSIFVRFFQIFLTIMCFYSTNITFTSK